MRQWLARVLQIGRRGTPPAAQRRHFSALQAMSPDRRRDALARPGASEWIEAAAQYGIVEAQVALGQLLLDGAPGRPRDAARALAWFAAAAGAGYPPGLNMLGRCHELGWGTPANPARAAPCYLRAAEAGLDWGQFNLGCLLLYGLGVDRDRAAALRWFGRAAAAGHAKAMNMVGRFHENGWEVPSDADEAMRWYWRAAEGGDFRGQFNLGSMLAERGRKGEAVPWISRALATGSADFLQEAGKSLMASGDQDYKGLGRAALGLNPA